MVLFQSNASAVGDVLFDLRELESGKVSVVWKMRARLSMAAGHGGECGTQRHTSLQIRSSKSLSWSAVF